MFSIFYKKFYNFVDNNIFKWYYKHMDKLKPTMEAILVLTEISGKVVA